jgi:hypothetical protein
MRRGLAVIVIVGCGAWLVSTTLACGGSSSSSSSSTGPVDAGSSDAAKSGCTAQITGAVTATTTCIMQASSGDTIKFFGLYGFDASGHQLGAFVFLAADPEAKTYTPADVQSASGLFAELPDGGGARWTMTKDVDGGAVGTFSLDVTDLGSSTAGGTGSNLNEIWASPHGSYTATYEAEPGGSATGSITMDVTF